MSYARDYYKANRVDPEIWDSEVQDQSLELFWICALVITLSLIIYTVVQHWNTSAGASNAVDRIARIDTNQPLELNLPVLILDHKDQDSELTKILVNDPVPTPTAFKIDIRKDLDVASIIGENVKLKKSWNKRT